MRNPRFVHATVLAIGFQLLALSLEAHTPAQEMAEAAKNWVAALSPAQRTVALFEFKDEQRFDWHFVPRPRKGLSLKEMTSPQRALAYALLSSALSQRGFMKATTIISLEQILYELESQSPSRNSDLYFFSIFGEPGNAAWGWRVEGHHLSLNFAIQDDHVLSVTPSFFGANPAEIQSGPRKGLRTLGEEEDLARQLVKSLDASQLSIALVATNAPREIITGNSRQAKALEPAGIPVSKLNARQKELWFALLREYVFRYRREIAKEDLKKIKASSEEKIYFAWAGGLNPGEGHYYRLQGPTFLMEYDNTQDHANHIHTVWRDLQNDFGLDLLRQHYDQVPHSK